VPEVVYRLLGNGVILTAVYLFFLASIFVHGLFLFDESPKTKVLTLVFGFVVLGITVVMLCTAGHLNDALSWLCIRISAWVGRTSSIFGASLGSILLMARAEYTFGLLNFYAHTGGKK
jgi:hypothetical protein